MSQFTLDYTQPPPVRRTRARRSGLARLLVLFVGWAAVSPILVLGLLAGLFHYRAENQGLRFQQERYMIQYDSLLAAKQATDRQLLEFRQQVRQPTGPVASDTVASENRKKLLQDTRAGF